MSALTIVLERISRILKWKAPKIVSRLQPGLTPQEIDEKTKDLPGRLPEEVYELYQWHNGFSSSNESLVFLAFNEIEADFLSLEASINRFKNLKYYGCPSNLFVIFEFCHENGGEFLAFF